MKRIKEKLDSADKLRAHDGGGRIDTGVSKPMSGATAVIAACVRATGRAFAEKALIPSRLAGPST
jgi:hypothetical protein